MNKRFLKMLSYGDVCLIYADLQAIKSDRESFALLQSNIYHYYKIYQNVTGESINIKQFINQLDSTIRVVEYSSPLLNYSRCALDSEKGISERNNCPLSDAQIFGNLNINDM